MPYQFRAVRILVVESAPQMFELVKSLLTAFGVEEVFGAYDVESGFQKYCQVKPDLVICDWLGGRMNGLDFVRLVRQDPRSPNPYTPVLLMAGYTAKKRVLAARDTGITEFLAKPFTAKNFYERLEHIIERPRQFVRAGEFFGPDRRRKRADTYEGPERRADRALQQQVTAAAAAGKKSAAGTARAILNRNTAATTDDPDRTEAAGKT